jgi:hypothetical protein
MESSNSIALLRWQRQRGIVVLSLFVVVPAGEERLLEALPGPKVLEQPKGREGGEQKKGKRGEGVCDGKEEHRGS